MEEEGVVDQQQAECVQVKALGGEVDTAGASVVSVSVSCPRHLFMLLSCICASRSETRECKPPRLSMWIACYDCGKKKKKMWVNVFNI